MIELLDKESLGSLKKNTVSFLVTYEIKNITLHESSRLNEKLETNKFYIKKDCYFYSDVFYDEDTSKTIISITLYLSTSDWLERYEKEWILDEYAINIQKLFECIIIGKIQI